MEWTLDRAAAVSGRIFLLEAVAFASYPLDTSVRVALASYPLDTSVRVALASYPLAFW
jgi:hypothetical protein